MLFSRAIRRVRDVAGMPATVPMPTKASGDVLTSALWNTYVRDNIDKLLSRGHRVLTVAQFAALSGLEGTKGTTPPDEVYLEVDSTNGIQWHFAYESGEPTYKWRFLGGPDLYSIVATDETTTSTAFVGLTTAGPSITTPRAGDYDIELQSLAYGTQGLSPAMGYDLGATAATRQKSNLGATPNSGAAAVTQGYVGRAIYRELAVAASTVILAKYVAHDGGAFTNHFLNRILRLRPVRIS